MSAESWFWALRPGAAARPRVTGLAPDRDRSSSHFAREENADKKSLGRTSIVSGGGRDTKKKKKTKEGKKNLVTSKKRRHSSSSSDDTDSDESELNTSKWKEEGGEASLQQLEESTSRTKL